MNTQALIEQALSGSLLAEVGNEFFADKTRTKEQTKDFITALLERGAYEHLATVMSYGYIDNVSGDGYLPNPKRHKRLSDRYFENFMDLCVSSEVDFEFVWPMLFAAFDAPKDSFLYSFVGGIDNYFTRFTFNDYDAAAEIIRKYDKKFKCLSTLMEADKTRTVSMILNNLLYGKGANKTLLRKYILEKRVDVVPSLCREYIKSKAKEKEGIVRLLLLYKGDPRAERFLEEIERSEKSVTVRNLIEKDKSAAKKRETPVEEEVIGEIEADGVKYTLTPNGDLTVKITPENCPKEVRAEAEKIEKRMYRISSRLELDMENNVRMPCDEFVNRVKTDSVYAAIASALLFSVYKDNTLSDIIAVDNGEMHDLDNKKRELSGVEVAVSHPTEWEYFGFLKGLDVKQPFEQVRRTTFVASDAEKMYNFSGRVRGVIMPAGAFKSAMNKNGFKPLNRNRYDESNCAAKTRGDITCVLEFSPTNFSNTDKLVSMGDVRFYRYADLIKLGGQTYTDGVKPYSIASLSPIAFSEFLRDVFRTLKLCGGDK